MYLTQLPTQLVQFDLIHSSDWKVKDVICRGRKGVVTLGDLVEWAMDWDREEYDGVRGVVYIRSLVVPI